MSISPQSSHFSHISRLEIEYLQTLELDNKVNDGSDIIAGLNQFPKSFPSHYFYDQRGSQLFEKICELPEYYPTRTEASLLQACALEIAKFTGICQLIELGSGSSTKTRLLLDAYQFLGYPLRYVPIDISPSILEESAIQLLENYPSLQVYGLVGTYQQALQQLTPSLLPARMICFLGSTLGNFTQPECDRFFGQITSALEPGDYFLLGIDLQKPIDILEAAYNDRQGITAAFNLNILNHLNRRFEGNFNPNLFQHWAFYNSYEHQIEMHLICQKSHTVHLSALDLTVEFKQEETIRTEISRKFDLKTMQQYLTNQQLKPLQFWTDENQWFGLVLCQYIA